MITKCPVRRVAIFGATSGIAVEVARRFAEARCNIVLLARDEDMLKSTAADLRVRGSEDVVTIAADFSDLDHVGKHVDAAWSAFGGLDSALIAYGTLPDQKAAEADLAIARSAIDMNFTSPALTANALAVYFERQRSGVIAVITSVAGDRGRMSNYAYGAAKGGLQHFLEGLRHRLHRCGVAVVDIRPGFVETRMTEHLNRGGFLWAKPQRVAADIVDGIAKKRAVIYTPWFWRLIMSVITSIPRSIIYRTKL
jgi:decaprenylphospho-beta-D-erythro-pentofuranosid-2-ulose 2-reductase